MVASGKNATPAREPYDVLIVGGGINGCGIARDAAGRGFSVCLAEMNDFASATSSGSTKLIHGGLRYLERYNFRLVHEALKEREVLWSIAPHIVWPLRFVLPHHRGLRPAWLLRLGLFLYDHLGGRRLLPPTRVIDLGRDALGEPLKPIFTKGFEYSDCGVDDARLVVLNARDAADHGAEILPRTKVIAAQRDSGRGIGGLGGLWTVTTETADGAQQIRHARVLVNAAGPWVDQVLCQALGRKDADAVRLVRGSHIIVRRLFDHEHCYIFQNADGRIIFAIPYETDFTLIGTTDRDHHSDPGDVRITAEETDYLCTAASAYFINPVEPTDVVHSYSAVRPLYNDGASKAQEATRDYVLKTETTTDGPALINVFGGKITTYRKLAESALEQIQKQLGRRGAPWTAGAALPGGDFHPTGFNQQVEALRTAYRFLDPAHARRLVRLYGTRAWAILGAAKTLTDLGECFGADLHEAELHHLVEREWAASAEDVLWRRSKLGLRFTEAETQRLAQYLGESPGPR
ncbi:MAG: glycerol-3-phosphate dehydrogenase [Proteobacteria bacterium]|nr:glycerol-3-phosphate dehydrogenase [Pseudomonadota bacterium]